MENEAHGLSVDAKSQLNLDWTTDCLPIIEEILSEKRGDHEPILHAVSASELKSTHVEWFMQERIPIPGFCILEGEGGLGKTTVALDLVARASRGGQLPDGSAGLGVVKSVLFASEDATSRIKALLQAARADLTNIVFVPWVDTTDGRASFILPNHAEALSNMIVRTGARLVYIDSLFDTFAPGLDTNSSRDVRSALGPLRDVANNTGCVALATRHVTKSIGRAAVRGLGSFESLNIARSVLQLNPHPQDPEKRLLTVVKKNYGQPCDALAFRIEGVDIVLDDGHTDNVSVIKWLGTDATTADEAALGLTSKIDLAEAVLLSALEKGPVRSAEVEAHGYSRATVWRAREALVTKGYAVSAHKTGLKGGWVWQLDAGPTA
jgi:RecA-family ATPase